MTMLIGGLAAIAFSLAILMAFAWVVQQRSGNSGWVDTVWTFAVGLVGATSALRPARLGPHRISMFFPLPPREGMAV